MELTPEQMEELSNSIAAKIRIPIDRRECPQHRCDCPCDTDKHRHEHELIRTAIRVLAKLENIKWATLQAVTILIVVGALSIIGHHFYKGG